jgi:hypothetical protein
MTELWQFQKFDKIPRLRRGVVVTEKIDGTNGQIVIIDIHKEAAERQISPGHYMDVVRGEGVPYMAVGTEYLMLAGSRKRWLTNEKQGDNYGFGRWVSENREELLSLGEGRHYGEWWGAGIQRRYGLNEKRFSLFNTGRWGEQGDTPPACCSVVPVLETGDFNNILFEIVLEDLRMNGSVAAPGFMNPEGIVIYMTQARRLFKITLENDGVPKSIAKPKKASTILKTSAEWIKDYPVNIIDPDGWDRGNMNDFHKSFNVERITLAEFKYRVSMSTIEGGFEWLT